MNETDRLSVLIREAMNALPVDKPFAYDAPAIAAYITARGVTFTCSHPEDAMTSNADVIVCTRCDETWPNRVGPTVAALRLGALEAFLTKDMASRASFHGTKITLDYRDWADLVRRVGRLAASERLDGAS